MRSNKPHNIKIHQPGASYLGTTVEVDGKELRGIVGLTYDVNVNETPLVTIDMRSSELTAEVAGELEIIPDLKDIYDAVKCIRLYMSIDGEFKEAVIASARSAIEEVRNANRMDVTTDYELAAKIIDRVFTGER